MIGLKATLNVIDNSGAQIVECIRVLKVMRSLQLQD
jgi:ribosomal protein L14